MAFADDITVTAPSDGGFAVRDSNAVVQFRVDEATGTVTISELPSTTPANTPACFDSATGQLGPCAAGLGDFANFYALMPGDNAMTVATGSDVQFPTNGPNSGGGISRVSLSTSSFELANIGTYQVMF